MSWTVEFHSDFAVEFAALDEEVQDELAAHVELLKAVGPQLRRPHADTLAGSSHANMKELRFGTAEGSGASPMRSTLIEKQSCWSPATRPEFRNGDSTQR